MADSLKDQFIPFLNDELTKMEQFRRLADEIAGPDDGILAAALTAIESLRESVIAADEPLTPNWAHAFKTEEERLRAFSKGASVQECKAELAYRADRLNEKLREMGATYQEVIVSRNDAPNVPARVEWRWCFPDQVR